MYQIRSNKFRVAHFVCVTMFMIGSSQAVIADDETASRMAIASLPAIDCVINPYQVIDLASPVRGVIDKLHVKRSQPVKKNQMVAQLESSVEQSTVALAERRASITSEINVSRINLAFDERRKQRYERLYNENAVSTENVDEANKEHELSTWKLQQSQEQLDVRQLELNRAREQLRQKTIRAPINGYVLDTYKHSGEYVEDQPIMRIAQLDPLIIEAIMPMENYGLIKVGMQAEIQPEVLASDRLKGKVTVIDRIGDTASGTFGVRLEMPNPDSRLPAGLKCVAKFIYTEPEQLAAEVEPEPEPVTETVETVASSPEPQPVDQVAEDVQHVESQPTEIVEADRIPDSHEQVEEASVTSVDMDSQNTVVAISTKTEVPVLKQQTPSIIKYGELASMQYARSFFVAERYSPESGKKGYIVLLSQAENRLENRQLLGTLRLQGVEDFIRMDQGPYKGFISLGLYNGPVGAEKRRKQLESLNIFATLDERY